MTKSSKITIALLVIILIAVLGIGVWLITDKSAENGSVSITENTAGVANNETVTGNTSVNNNSSNQSQQQNQNTNNSSSNNTSNTQAVDISIDTRQVNVNLEGMVCPVTTSKYISSLGYSMRYDSDMTVKKVENMDIYGYTDNPEAYVTVKYISTPYSEAISNFTNSRSTTINGYEATEARDGIFVKANNGTYIIDIVYPVDEYGYSEYAEGFGDMMNQLIETYFSINN